MIATMTAPMLALFNALKTVMTETAASQAVQSIEQIVKTNDVEREDHSAQSVLYRVEKEIDSKIANEHKDLATKGDLMAVKSDLMAVRTELKEDVMRVREDLMAVRTELKEDVMKVREEIQKQNKSFISINVAIFAVIISILLYVVSRLP